MALFDFLQQTSYSFEGRKEGETVKLFLHRHWFTVISKLIFLIACIMFPAALFIVFGQYIAANGLIAVFAFFWACLVMACWLIFFYAMMIYTLDTWLVTDMRIINSAQRGFFERDVSELSISNIQDVSIRIDGFVATTMNFGDIEVQTAGGAHHFTFKEIPNPTAVKDAVIAVVDEYKMTHKMNSTSL